MDLFLSVWTSCQAEIVTLFATSWSCAQGVAGFVSIFFWLSGVSIIPEVDVLPFL
jgi:hypothetical protein